MAQEVLGNVETWLPSEFLDDDFFMEEKRYRRRVQAFEPSPAFTGSLCFPYDCNSNLSSPLESEESDEEDRLNNGVVAGLTQQMARSFRLHEPLHRSSHSAQGYSLACSPQSPLCTGGMWSDWSHEPSKGVPPQVTSPTPLESKPDSAFDLLYAAAGQVRRMNLSDDVEQLKRDGGHGLLGPPRKLSPPCKGAPNPMGYYCYDGARRQHHTFLFNQMQQLKQQQRLKQQQLAAALSRQNRIRASMGMGNPSGGCYPPLLSHSTWPPLLSQQPPTPAPSPGSGMRAVFLGPNGVRKQSTGTGVFLPRRVGCPAEPRRKPACSTVLVPAKVVQALNLNLEDMGAQPRFPNGSFFVDHETFDGRNSADMINQRRAPPPPPAKLMSQEMRLPPEWTY